MTMAINARINQLLFTQTSLDSGALTMLGVVIHSFKEPGRYRGTVLLKERPLGRFDLMVDDDCEDAQVNIDLASLKGEESFRVSPRGAVVFHVSRGPGGFAVRVGRLTGEKEDEVFDSRELKEGDMFAATLIRPGNYTVSNAITRASGEIMVSYPQVGDAPYKPDDPVSIAVGQSLSPSSIKIGPAQGQVYRIGVPSRIRIDLARPDDGPKGPGPRPRPGWRKPGRKGTRQGAQDTTV
jgi:hypothetical protein